MKKIYKVVMGNGHDFWARAERALPIKKIGGTGKTGNCPLRKSVARACPIRQWASKWAFTNTVISYLIYQNQVGLGRVGNFTSWVHFP